MYFCRQLWSSRKTIPTVHHPLDSSQKSGIRMSMRYEIISCLRWCIINWFVFVNLLERRLVHLDLASTRWRSTERRIAMRAMESNTECRFRCVKLSRNLLTRHIFYLGPNHFTLSNLIAQRTQHVQPCKCRCKRYVSKMARLKRTR